MFTKEQLDQIIDETAKSLVDTDFIQVRMKEVMELHKDCNDKGIIYEKVSEAELFSLWMQAYGTGLNKYNNALKEIRDK